jgi:membrane protein DedA with SNARE-associated domain
LPPDDPTGDEPDPETSSAHLRPPTADGRDGPDDAIADAAGTPDAVPGLGRRGLAILVGLIIALLVCSNLANAFFPKLSTEYPLLLIAMSAANRNLILVGGQVPVVAYFVVGAIRLLIPDVLFYLLGYHYGDRATTWMTRRTPRVGQLMGELERLFQRFGWAIVLFLPLLIPSNPICLVAGAARMRPRVFWSLNAVGIVGRLVVMLWLGDVFSEPIDWLLGFISDYRLPLTVVTVGLVGFTFWRETRAGTSDIQQLLEMEEELEPEPEDGNRP